MPRKLPGGWVRSSSPPQKPKIPENLKAEVTAKAGDFIETILKPKAVKPPPEEEKFNYITDIYGRWRGSSYYFCSNYKVAGPDAIEPNFEERFARLEYAGGRLFNLSFMRHTGEWVEIYPEISLEEVFEAIETEPFFIIS